VTEPDQVAYLHGDVVIDRVNALTTTLLDTVGTLLVAFAAGWAIWGCPWRQALGVAVAGLVVLAVSALSQLRSVPKALPEVVADDEPVLLPGPSDPGALHIVGR
jgi:hypothetical protein